MSSDGTSLAVFGMLGNSPAIFTIDPRDGDVLDYSVYMEVDAPAAANVTIGAVYLQNNEDDDSSSVQFYSTFLIDKRLQFLRVSSDGH